MGFKTYPSKSQPVKPDQQRGQTRRSQGGTKDYSGPATPKNMDATRKSKVHEQGNPYKAVTMRGRDEDTMMRNRMNDFGNKPREVEPMPEGTWPAKRTTISIG